MCILGYNHIVLYYIYFVNVLVSFFSFCHVVQLGILSSLVVSLFSWKTERGERSGISLFLSLGLGGACFPFPLGLYCPSYPGWGDAGHCMGASCFIFSLTGQEFNDTES